MIRPRNRYSITSSVLTLGLLAAMSQTGEAARGVVVKQATVTPVQDPKAQLNFDLNLVGFNQFFPADETTPADNITFLDIPGYASSHYDYVFSNLFTIFTTPGSAAGLTDVTLAFTAPNPIILSNRTPDDLPIGTFVIETIFEFDPSEYGPLLRPITYTTQTHLFPSGVLNIGQGVITPFVIPEPASLFLAATGLVGVAILARRRKVAGERDPLSWDWCRTAIHR